MALVLVMNSNLRKFLLIKMSCNLLHFMSLDVAFMLLVKLPVYTPNNEVFNKAGKENANSPYTRLGLDFFSSRMMSTTISRKELSLL